MIVDRIEGNIAIIEVTEGKLIELPLSILPDNVKEGDILKITVDNKGTEKRKREMERLADGLWE